MNNDIGAKLEGTAQIRRSKCVVYDQRNIVLMRNFCELLNIKNDKRRIGQSLAKDQPCIGFDCCTDLIFCCITVYPDTLNSKLLQCKTEKINRASIDRRAGNNAVSALGKIEDGKQAGCLTA